MLVKPILTVVIGGKGCNGERRTFEHYPLNFNYVRPRVYPGFGFNKGSHFF